MYFFEASAKTGVNIDEIFNELSESMDSIYGKNIVKQTQADWKLELLFELE